MSTRRRSLLVGAVVGVVLGALVAFSIARSGDNGGGSRIPATTSPNAIPTAPDLEGATLPDQSFARLDGGGDTTFAAYRGKPLVVNVWSTTCAPCVQEMPAIESVHQALGDQVQFVGVDQLDGVERAREFVQRVGVTYDILRDPQGDFVVAMKLVGMPTTLFVAADGTVVDVHNGVLDAPTLTAMVQDHLLT